MSTLENERSPLRTPAQLTLGGTGLFGGIEVAGAVGGFGGLILGVIVANALTSKN